MVALFVIYLILKCRNWKGANIYGIEKIEFGYLRKIS